jgi:UDP-N-acetylglucosamine 2-epimerase
VESAQTMLERDTRWANPFGDGKAAGRIIDVVEGKS